jgi:hypothetical protein
MIVLSPFGRRRRLLYKVLQFNIAQFRSIVHRLATKSRRLEDKQSEEEQALVRLYAEGDRTTTRCRRRVLDEYLDGRVGREGCEEGEERCDQCRGPEEEIEMSSEDNSEDEDEDREEQLGEVETDREETRRVLG